MPSALWGRKTAPASSLSGPAGVPPKPTWLLKFEEGDDNEESGGQLTLMLVESSQATEHEREPPDFIFRRNVPKSIRYFANGLKEHIALPASNETGSRTDRSDDIMSAVFALTRQNHRGVAVEDVRLQEADTRGDEEIPRGYIVEVKETVVGD